MKVLLVEDEPDVGKIILAFLKKWEMDGAWASGPEQALAHLEEFGADLLITDLVMPEMSGHQLAQHLRPQRPDMRILYMSGYTNDDLLRYGIQGHVPFLQKPFGPDDLIAKVHQVLSVS